MKVFESSLLRLTAGLTVLVCLGWLGSKVNANLGQLPVEQAADVSAIAEPIAVKAIFPVAIQPRAKAPVAVASAAIEEAFGSRATDEPIVPPPNFADLIRGTVKIDGVSSGGVFIGGRFYALGADVAALQASADGLVVVPRVVGVRPDRVVFDVGGSALVMTKADGVWQ